MGAEIFVVSAKGQSPQEAFRNAVDEARYWHGHGGYTGSIAEKSSFIMIDCPKDKQPEEFAYELIDNEDPRVDDKWGPAGCIDLKNGKYLFFGWASS